MLYETTEKTKNRIIYGSRIAQARELCGLTQTELSKRVGVNQSAIAQIETDRCMPSEELLNAISDITGFLPSFFYLEAVDNFPTGSLCYRSRASISAREAAQAYQYSKLVYEHVKIMSDRLKLLPVRLPRIQEKPQKAAEITRTSFGLSPDSPVKNLINTIEKNGVVIFTLPLYLPKLDAFSTWVELGGDIERPIIALSSRKPADRMRFSIAHEIGHLVMHQVLKGNTKLIEKDANEFAAEFLLPETAIKKDMLPPVTLTRLARLKVKWGVSMQMLIYRARELGIITERQAKYLFKQMAVRGWKGREPDNLDIPIETPKAITRMIELLYSDTSEYALDMHMRADKAREFLLWV